MLKNISNLGTVLNKSEQQKVKGGVVGTQWWEVCQEQEPECNCDAIDNGEYGPTHSPDCNYHN